MIPSFQDFCLFRITNQIRNNWIALLKLVRDLEFLLIFQASLIICSIYPQKTAFQKTAFQKTAFLIEFYIL